MSRKPRRPIVVGVTGSFGTGKTTVAKMFKALGAVVLDADRLAHKTLRKDTTSHKDIVRAFGRRILDKSGNMDKSTVARIVFKNKKSLKKLCDIVHPHVIDNIKESIKDISQTRSAPAIVIDAPLLIESGLHNIVDCLVVVKTSRSTQIKRSIKKTGLAPAEIMQRIKNQIPLNEKVKMADYVIDNEGSRRNTGIVVKRIWKEIILD